jgi:hypothetical protein
MARTRKPQTFRRSGADRLTARSGPVSRDFTARMTAERSRLTRALRDFERVNFGAAAPIETECPFLVVAAISFDLYR